MKISLKWLQDFVDVQDMMAKPEALAELLTKAGLEVEEITSLAKDFQFVVTGLILEKAKHPNADKLSLCRVMTGEGVVHQIVCGAQNHKQDDKVVVALPGAILPGGFAIKNSVIRDVESGGMLCSVKELGLATESDGILILPENAPIGKPFAEYQGLDDVTFELKVTPNRADCLSHYGLAREVACLLGRPLKKMAPQYKVSPDSTQALVALSVQSEQCPRYAGRALRGVKVQASPEWLKKRLQGVGLNSINNVVDVTNYVMIELGQPLHAFDMNEIKGKKIIVSQGQQGEKFETLQGVTLTLTGEELMIRDGERAVAMAGVVGGKNSGVSDATTEIFLEAAYFTPASVRKASRTHGITTDSAYRFSRGVDADNTFNAMERAVELILQVAGGEALSVPHDHYPHPIKKSPVRTEIKIISERLGYEAEAPRFEDYMTRLGCLVEKMGEGSYQILPPTYRFDLEIEMDLVEEYARLNGYDQIPETLPEQRLSPTPHDAGYLLSRKTSDVLRGAGYSQAVNMAFSGREAQEKFLGSLNALRAAGLAMSDVPVMVLNPLNAEANCMRSSLVEGLYRNSHHNFHQGVEVGRLFETGKTFSLKEGGEFQEHQHLGLVAWGYQKTLWTQVASHPLVFEVKAAVEKLLQQLHITSYQWSSVQNRGDIPDFIHRGQHAVLMVEGKAVGFIGSLHPSRLEDDKIRVPVALAELNLDLLFKGQPRGFRIETFSRYPRVERDLALVMLKPLKVGDVVREMKKSAGPLCTQIEVFDVYEGDNLAQGQKSVAFRLSYQDKTATLQDSVVNDSVTQVLAALNAKFSITVR